MTDRRTFLRQAAVLSTIGTSAMAASGDAPLAATRHGQARGMRQNETATQAYRRIAVRTRPEMSDRIKRDPALPGGSS